MHEKTGKIMNVTFCKNNPNSFKQRLQPLLLRPHLPLAPHAINIAFGTLEVFGLFFMRSLYWYNDY